MRAEARSVATCIALALSGTAPAYAAQQETPFTLASRYDLGGQLVGKIAPDPDGSGPLRQLAERYTYVNGLLVSIESGQLTSWPDETVAPANWGAYGFAGSNIFGSVEYAYDTYGRKATESMRGGDGNITSLLQYGYNDQNLVECKAVRMNPATYSSPQPNACTPGTPGPQGPDRIRRSTYDDLDQVLTQQRAYGTDLAQTYMTITYTGRQLRSQTDANGNRTELEYDSFGRLFRRSYPSKTSSGDANSNDYSEYTYEVNGNLRTERKRSGATITYTYDQNNRITAKTLSDRTYSEDVRYDYDLRGLMHTHTGSADISGNYAPNGLNQYGVIDGQRITYDANGNLTSDGTLTYTYDMENRLVGTSGTAAGLKYDPLGRLVEIAVTSGPTTHFLYDGDALVAEYTISGGTETRTRRYVHGNGANEPWVQYNGSAVGPSSRRYLHSDHHGSVIAQSDNTAAVLAKNTYDAFGIPGSNNSDRFGYTGQLWLRELGLNYYRARMYSPRLGRFLQTDPIGYADDANLYAYAGNDPLNRVDVFGLRACPEGNDGCFDDPSFKPGEEPPPVPDETKEIEEVVVTARKERKMADGTKINLGRTNDEQGFRVSKDGMVSRPLTKKGWEKCDDGSSRRAGMLDVSGLGAGENAGHTHPEGKQGDISGLPGPEDGRVAAATGKTAYVVSNRGAFAVESTSAGFRIRQLTKGKLSMDERNDMRDQIEAWNQNDGKSGRKCVFTPD